MWFIVNSLKPNPGTFQNMILRNYIMNQLSLLINDIKIDGKSEVPLQENVRKFRKIVNLLLMR